MNRPGYSPDEPAGGQRYGDRAVYFSDIVVRNESPCDRFADLRGRRFAFNERASHSGFNLVAYSLLQRNERLPFFGELVENGSHVDSLRCVATGAADAAAIDSHLIDVLQRQHSDVLGGLRIIESLGPSTNSMASLDVSGCPLQRSAPTDLDDIARAVLPLAETPSVNGQTLVVDRGHVLR